MIKPSKGDAIASPIHEFSCSRNTGQTLCQENRKDQNRWKKVLPAAKLEDRFARGSLGLRQGQICSKLFIRRFRRLRREKKDINATARKIRLHPASRVGPAQMHGIIGLWLAKRLFFRLRVVYLSPKSFF
jgi:hypothetical protein